jgi:hypothetical protein
VPAKPIAAECPLGGAHRRYLPSEVFLGRLSHLMNPEAGAHGRGAGGLMTPRFKENPTSTSLSPVHSAGTRSSRVVCARSIISGVISIPIARAVGPTSSAFVSNSSRCYFFGMPIARPALRTAESEFVGTESNYPTHEKSRAQFGIRQR